MKMWISGKILQVERWDISKISQLGNSMAYGEWNSLNLTRGESELWAEMRFKLVGLDCEGPSESRKEV